MTNNDLKPKTRKAAVVAK